ncbi:IPT/TIG domain-containing protein [Archangium gephyra]|uniref:IPT/TIG domain-containing protein n=1 Tax=Archangium gephyra TaxID=48 RepID=UPI0035D4FB0E
MSNALPTPAGWNQHGPRVIQIILFACLVLSGGCTDELPEAVVLPEPKSPLCEGTAPRTLDEVYAAHFVATQPTGCTAGCHESGAGGLSFHNAQELWQATVNQPTTGDQARLRVKPGWPERSQLYLKLLPEAQGRMPVGGPYLDTAALRDVAGWICSGAPAPTGGGTPPPDAGTGNPLPQLDSLSPSSVATQGAPFTLTLTGSGFLASSVVVLDGADVTTAYGGATSLTARIPTLSTAGGHSVAVRNPAPGGGTSNTLTLAAVTTSVPSITGLTPARVDADADFTLTVTGSGYVCSPPASRTTVLFNGGTATPSSCSSTQLTVPLPATPAGDYPVQVRNETGETSNPFTLGVGAPNPVPTLSSLSPCGTVAGAAGFTLTLSGSGFLSSSSVTFNGTPVTVTSVGASELRVSVPASLVASAPSGNVAAVVVTNPSPGGGASSPVSFGVASRAVTLAADVQPLFTRDCASAGCHNTSSAAAALDLSSGKARAELVGVPSSAPGCAPAVRVLACRPQRSQSVLLDKVLATSTNPACAGSAMPKGAPLTAAEKQLLVDWVAQGAPP